jgi:hypothetical protein
MINRTSPLLALVGTLTLIGCQSSNAPIGPSSVPESVVTAAPGSPEGGGAQIFLKPPDTGAVVIDRGELDFSGSFGEIRLEGNRGFSLTSHVDRIGGIVGAVEACSTGICTPGTVIPLYATWFGNDLVGTVTLDGTTYTQVGGLNSTTSAVVTFSARDAQEPRFEGVVAPPFTKRGSDQVTALFEMSGQFSHPGGPVPFTGEGVVKLWLVHTAESTGWRVERLLYRFKNRP